MTSATLALLSKIFLLHLFFKIQIYLANWTIHGSDSGYITALSLYNTSDQDISNSGILPGQSHCGLSLNHFLLQQAVDVEVEKSKQSQETGP